MLVLSTSFVVIQGKKEKGKHCVKSVQIWIFSGFLVFSVLKLNKDQLAQIWL